MRILVLSNCNLNENEGSGYVILNFARMMRERGHDVDVLGPESYPFRNRIRGRRYWTMLGILIAGVRRLIARRYDIVECYGGASWLLMWLLARLPRRRFRLVHHSNGIESHVDVHLSAARRRGWLPALHWYQRMRLAGLYDLGVRASDHVVTVSRYDGQYVVRERLKQRGTVTAIENPLPDAYLGLSVSSDRRKVVGFCGSWIDRKGVALVQHDVLRFLRESECWSLRLVGAGTAAIRQAPGFAGLSDRVECIDALPRAALRSWYQSLSILVVPSFYESFGLVIAEAMACGCAVVATRTAGFAASLRDGEEALLMESPESPALYDALKFLAGCETTRCRIAERGYHRVQRLRWSEAADRMEEVYAKLMADSAGRLPQARA